MGRTVAIGPRPGEDGLRPPARRRHDGRAEAQGGHPRPAQRREPRRRADAPRRSSASTTASSTRCRRYARRAALRAGARERRQALPVDAAPRLPAADLRARPSSTTSSRTAARRSRSDADPTDVPTMPIEFSVAAFRLGHAMIREPTTGTSASTTAPARSSSCSTSRPRAATSAAQAAAEQLDRRLPPALRLRRGRPRRPRRAGGKFNRAMRIDTTLVDPLRNLPPGSFGGPASDEATIRGEPRVPQPDAGEDGQARDGPADGRRFLKGGVSVTTLTSAQIRDGDGGASLDALTAAQRAGAARATRRCGSTSCARPSSTTAG